MDDHSSLTITPDDTRSTLYDSIFSATLAFAQKYAQQTEGAIETVAGSVTAGLVGYDIASAYNEQYSTALSRNLPDPVAKNQAFTAALNATVADAVSIAVSAALAEFGPAIAPSFGTLAGVTMRGILGGYDDPNSVGATVTETPYARGSFVDFNSVMASAAPLGPIADANAGYYDGGSSAYGGYQLGNPDNGSYNGGASIYGGYDASPSSVGQPTDDAPSNLSQPEQPDAISKQDTPPATDDSTPSISTSANGSVGSDAVAAAQAAKDARDDAQQDAADDASSRSQRDGIGSDAVAGGTAGTTGATPTSGEAAPANRSGYDAQGSQYGAAEEGDSGAGSPSGYGGAQGTDGDEGDRPVILDLSGGGINVAPLTSSNTFVKLDDGYSHRTAWAGAGDAVLFYDPTSSNQISQGNQFVFTDWDPTASSDMEALRDVFDTNHDGKLDAGDAGFSLFKLLVTNADGTTTVQTLTQAGITSINLVASGADVQQVDGSAVTGQTTYTRSNGTMGAAADVTLVADANGCVLRQAVTHNGDGSTTIDNKTYNPSGDLASETTSTTSASGLSRTLTADNNGDGTVDGKQTDVTVVNADSSKTETVSDYGEGGVSLVDSFATTTSADGKTVTIKRDFAGGGIVQQTEARVTNADNSTTDTVSNVNGDGSTSSKTVTGISANGLVETTQTDHVGSGTYDLTTTDATVVNQDSSRTETVSDANADNSTRDQTVTTTSASGQGKTIKEDHAGSGTFDLTLSSATVTNADSSSTTTVSATNADSSSRGKLVNTISADGLTKTAQADLNADGVIDRTTTDATSVAADGTRTETVATRAANSTLLTQTVTSESSDGISRSTTVDGNGDGATDLKDVVAVAASGVVTDTRSLFNPDGTSVGSTLTTTTANGLSRTVQEDHTGRGVYDLTVADSKTPTNGGGSSELIEDKNADGSTRGKVLTTISADDLTTTTQTDLDGDGGWDRNVTVATVLNSDGSRTQTASTTSHNAGLLSRSVTATSADRRSVMITTDGTGDGKTTRLETAVTSNNGTVTDTVQNTSYNGALINRSVTTTSANGLSETTQLDQAGTGNSFNLTTTDVTTYNGNGSRTEAVNNRNGDGSLRDATTTTTSGNGLAVTVVHDFDGDNSPNLTTSDVTTYNADGSTSEAVRNTNQNGSLRNSTVTTTSGTGLLTTLAHDFDGDNIADLTTTEAAALNADGSTVNTVTDTDVHGTRDQSVTTASPDRKTITAQRQVNGSVTYSERETTSEASNGSVTDNLAITNDGGQSIFGRVITTAANGLSQTIQTDVDGDGNPDIISADTVAIANNGVRTETGTTKAGSTLIQQTVSTTSANGLIKDGQIDFDGDDKIDLDTTDATAYAADGSVTETVKSVNQDSSIRSQVITAISTDRRTTSVNRVYGSDGNQVDQGVNQDDGTVFELISNYNDQGLLTGGKNVSTSGDGLSRTTTFTDASGATLDKATDIVTLNNNGSRTENYGDQDGQVSTTVVATTSANGLDEITQLSLNGQVSYNSNDVTVMSTDGSDTETVTDAVGSTVADKLVTSLSANGLTRVTSLDANDDGRVDLIDTTTYAADGTKVDTTIAYQTSDLLQQQKDVIVTSADGRTTILQSARNGDSANDHFETTILRPDGSLLDTNWVLNPNNAPDYKQTRLEATTTTGGQSVAVTDTDGAGNVEDRSVTTVSSTLLSSTTATQSFGYGPADLVRTETTVLNADGSQTETIKETGLAGSGNSNGGLLYEQIKNSSADGLTVTTVADDDGNGIFEVKDVQATAPGGSKTETVTNYNNATGALLTATAVDGSTYGATLETVSTNGLITTSTQGAMTSTTITFANANGSYEWADGSTAAGQIAAALHVIDANKVDTWTYTPTNGATVTVSLDTASEAKAVSLAQGVAQAVLGRALGETEVQALGQYISGGVLNEAQYTDSLLGSSEYTQRYGTLGSAFMVRAAENLFGRLPAAGDIGTLLNQIQGGTTTRAAAIDVLVQKAQDEIAGNGLLQFLADTTGATASTLGFQPGAFSTLVGTGTAYQSFVLSFSPPRGSVTASGTSAFVNLVYGSSTGVTTQQGNNLLTASANGTTDELFYGTSTSIDAAASGFAKLVDVSNRNSTSSYNTLTSTSGISLLTGSNYDALIGGSGTSTLQALGSYEHVTTGSGTNNVYVLGDSVSVNAGAGTSNIEIGAVNTTVTGANSKTTIDIGGSGASITGSGASVTLEAGSSVTLAGSGNIVTAGTGSSLTVSGTGDILNENGAAIQLNSGASASLVGNENCVNQQSNSSLSTSGESNFVTISGSGVIDSLGYSLVNFASSTSGTINGDNNSLLLGSSDTVAATGSSISATLQGSQSSLNVASGIVIVTGGVFATVTGNNNTINAGYQDDLTAQGSGLAVSSLESGRLTLGSGSVATLTGDGDTVGLYNNTTLNATEASNAQIYVQGAGNSLVVGSETVTLLDGSSATVTGNGNELVFSGEGTTLTASGSSEHLVFPSSPEDSTFVGYDSSDTFQFSKTDISDFSQFRLDSTQQGADTIVHVDGSHTATLKGVMLSSLAQSQFTFV